MSIGSGGWVPQLSSTLQRELQNLESSQYIGSQLASAQSKIYQETISEAMPLVSQQAGIQTEVTNLNSLKSALTSLQSAIQTLGTQSTWQAVTATSSNTNALTVTASSGAPQTSTTFDVTQQAQNQISLLNVTATSATAATQISSGTIVINSPAALSNNNNQPISISVNAGDSLTTIAQDINAVSPKTDVSASIMQNGSTYQLMLTDSQTGTTAGAFSIDSSSTATVNGTTLALTQVQQAQDASLTLAGNLTVTSSTNTFTNVLPNTTMNVVSTGTGTITISPNPQKVMDAANSFFDAYNKVESLVYNGGAAANTTLGSLIATQLPALVSQYDSSNPVGYQSLSQIGIMTTPGSYSISSTSSAGQSNFSSQGSPTIGFEDPTQWSGVPSGVSLPSGQTTFTNDVTNDPTDMQNLLGVSSTGLNLPSSSVLGQLNASIKVWLQDLNGTTVGNTTISGEISTLQSQIGSSTNGTPAGSIGAELYQLNQNYTNQIQSLLSQWTQAQSAMVQANQQLTQLQAIAQQTQSTAYQTATMLGG